MEDVEIKSYSELIERLHPLDKTPFNRYRSNFVFRGVADSSWHLETSLQRSVANPIELEKPLLRSFKRYAEPGSSPDNSLLTQLSVAQHHGLPTRLLDWTVAPQVAIHFATAEEEHYDKDGVIWCVDIVKARRLLTKEYRQILKEERAYLFSVDMLKHIDTFQEFDKGRQMLLFLEPPSLDGRIVNQWGIMSIMTGAQYMLHEYLENHKDIYYKVFIPAKVKWEIRDRLDQNNVTERMLFPGLDGLCKWLKRYYGKGPKEAGEPNSQPSECD